METSKKQTLLFTEDKSTSSQADSLANHTQQQANDLERKMTATSGLKCLEQLERFNHVGLWAKTFVALLIGMTDWYSKRCRLTWKMKGTKSNRLYFLLQASTLRTEEIECGLLLTPTSVMTDERPEKMRERVARNGYKNGTKYGSLLSQVKYGGMLPTPVASDVEGGVSDPRQIKNKGTRWVRVSDNTSTEFGAKLRDVAQMLPNTDGKTSQLNPLFVEEMMGFPESWTLSPFLNGEENLSKPTETQ
jgi:hypothetical protein